KKTADGDAKAGGSAKQESTKSEKLPGNQNPQEAAKVIVAAVVPTPFESSGESHEFFADVQGGKATLEVASRRLNVQEFIDALDRRADLLEEKERTAAKDAIKKARAEVTKLADEFKRAA